MKYFYIVVERVFMNIYIPVSKDYVKVTYEKSKLSYLYGPSEWFLTKYVYCFPLTRNFSQILKGPKFRETRSFKWRHNFMSIMNSVDEYARHWTKSEEKKLATLSDRIKSIQKLSKHVSTIFRVCCELFITLYLRNKRL
jgi:Xaa-Pro aminopeptidase